MTGGTVVDLGCADRGNQWPSLTELVERYQPAVIYGFDPSPQWDTTPKRIGGAKARLHRKAAWTYNGSVMFEDDYVGGPGPRYYGTTTGRVYGDPERINPGRIGTVGIGELEVPCFDFATWLKRRGPAVVKMDIEGAEYALLEHLIKEDAHRLISELVIEWHLGPDAELLDALECPVVEWWM